MNLSITNIFIVLVEQIIDFTDQQLEQNQTIVENGVVPIQIDSRVDKNHESVTNERRVETSHASTTNENRIDSSHESTSNERRDDPNHESTTNERRANPSQEKCSIKIKRARINNKNCIVCKKSSNKLHVTANLLGSMLLLRQAF